MTFYLNFKIFNRFFLKMRPWENIFCVLEALKHVSLCLEQRYFALTTALKVAEESIYARNIVEREAGE